MSEETGTAIPPAFWGTVSHAEFVRIVERGHLDRGQCIRLWEMLGRLDTPPPRVELFVDGGDLLRLLAHMKRAPEGAPDGAGPRLEKS